MKNHSKQTARQIAHPMLRALILAGFAMLIVQLVRTDNLVHYIAPRMELYVKLSALGLYAAAVYQIFTALRALIDREHHAKNCDCEGGHEPRGLWRNAFIYSLFLLPLALGFLLPDTTMGSSLAAKKGVAFSGSEQAGVTSRSPSPVGPRPEPAQGEAGEQNLDALFPADEYTVTYAEHAKSIYLSRSVTVPEPFFIETLTTLDLYRNRLEGVEVILSGFVYREEAMAGTRFAVSRFAMNCCSADAKPYGLIVDYAEAARFADDEWVKVTGILRLGEYNGNEVIALEAQSIERIVAPETPYVYPNYEFGA